MFSKLVILVVYVLLGIAATEDIGFIYNGFHSTNLTLDGAAEFTPNGLLKLTNATKQQGHTFYPNPITFKNLSNSSAFSFSTTYVFAIVSQYQTLSGHGIAFVIAPTRGLPGALPIQYLGLFNETNNGNVTNNVFAVELDTVQINDLDVMDNNHVGIDVNGLKSEFSKSAGYFVNSNGEFKNLTLISGHPIDVNGLKSEFSKSAGYFVNSNGEFKNLTLISGHPMQVWVEYDGVTKQINVTLGPINVPKTK